MKIKTANGHYDIPDKNNVEVRVTTISREVWDRDPEKAQRERIKGRQTPPAGCDGLFDLLIIEEMKCGPGDEDWTYILDREFWARRGGYFFITDEQKEKAAQAVAREVY